MCRCCQSCWESIYWNCYGEKFEFDESITNYNPDDDDENCINDKEKNGVIIRTQSGVNNNLPICNQPLSRGNSNIFSSKIHEEDYRREIQTNVPILAPEILAVFANSQIFQDHQPKLSRINTKSYMSPTPTVHKDTNKGTFNLKETDEEKLIRRLEAPDNYDTLTTVSTTSKDKEDHDYHPDGERKVKFTIAPDSSPETKRSASPVKFESIVEEDSDKETNEVVLRPVFPATHLMPPNLKTHLPKRPLRNVQSVPYFSVRPSASETDIFSITGSGSFGQISMTPEVPSISYSNLPKNYEDTPTIEKFKPSVSLYSIQTANEARASNIDYSMPRYFRKSQLLTQSTENLRPSSSRDEIVPTKRFEKSNRLKLLRDALPPLMIHASRSKKDDGKQVD